MKITKNTNKNVTMALVCEDCEFIGEKTLFLVNLNRDFQNEVMCNVCGSTNLREATEEEKELLAGNLSVL